MRQHRKNLTFISKTLLYTIGKQYDKSNFTNIFNLKYDSHFIVLEETLFIFLILHGGINFVTFSEVAFIL